MDKKVPKQSEEGGRTRSILNQTDNWREGSASRTSENWRGRSTSRTSVNFRKKITPNSTTDGPKSAAENNERSKRNIKNYQSRRGGFAQANAQRQKSRTVSDELEKLTQENPANLIRQLNSEAFRRLLNSELNNDHIVIIIQLIAQVCSSNSSADRNVLLTMICKENFWETLKKFVLTLPFQSEKEHKECRYWKNQIEFWMNVYRYCATILDVIPALACDVLQKLLTRVTCTLETLEIPHDVKLSFEDLKATLEKCKDEIKSQKVSQVVEPPNNFRSISLYPTSSEITTTEKTFLRKNVTKGSYDSVEHYLDVQFRLLREDFVAPLRKGVLEYLLKGDNKKIQNVKVHTKVRLVRHELVNGIRGVVLQLNQSNMRDLNYASSRRFMFGALLCFTSDNFKSILFGKIINQEDMVVAFEGHFKYAFNVEYVMVECKVYFEPYYHVLKALKLITEENFPMKEYLVDVTRQVEPPDYHRVSNRLIIGGQYEANVATNLWPNANQLRLNDSQYGAFKNALSQKFVVIQGPPGTGKTYVGLLLAKTLLRNSKLWKSDGGPMLVVAYTNHALDQFLEGLLDTTDDIVRIGGRSKNENLYKFNIKNLRKCTRDESFWSMHDAVENQVRILKENYATLETINKYEGIINLSYFLHERPELKGTWFQSATAENIGNWLLGRRRHRQQINLVTDQVLQKLQALRIDGSNSKAGEEVFDNVNRAEHRFNLDDFNVSVSSDVAYIVKVERLKGKIHQMAYTLNFINNIKENEFDVETVQGLLEEMGFPVKNEWDIMPCCIRLEEDLRQAEAELIYLETRLDEGKSAVSHLEPIEGDFHTPGNIAPEVRWQWYFYWLDEYKVHLKRKLVYLEEQYRRLYQEYEEVRTEEDIQIMRSQLVVGMTTTSAARLQAALQTLECPIVIVEEAAEILEAHTIASLTNKCQHLILIGDHQQLRPSTADYSIEKNFFLGISLFERMIMNDVKYNLLDVQHRMRPEIAKLIVPAIYPELKNHKSVEKFPMVGGITSCLYFITHTNEEEVSGDSSKTNLHEATFLLKLARYLILNGYAPEDVTILAAYSGQMFMLLNERERMIHWKRWRVDFKLLNNVRITTLDNYQGEESKIILLSLVRNNDEGKIGFLAIANRVCVALSRAKEGFYIMGNIDLLASRSQVWLKVSESLQAQNAVGTSLALTCQNHPSTVTHVETADDFKEVPEGGCNKICGQVLECGHSCKVKCHFLDKEHKFQYNCKEKCPRFSCDFNHPCPRLCSQRCGSCTVPVPKLLPCGHEQDVACHLDPKEHICKVLILSKLHCGHEVKRPCYVKTNIYPHLCNEKIEKCGHVCRSKCHVKTDPNHVAEYKCKEKCEKYAAGCMVKDIKHLCPLNCGDECQPCKILVKKTRTACEHVFSVACSVNADDVPCSKPCKKNLPCGHPCKLRCMETCGKCEVMVKKTLPECNHEVTVKCCEDPTRAVCRGKCPRTLPCGHPCSATCKEKCTEKCQALIDSPFEADCGHTFKIPCHLKNEDLESNDRKLLQLCREPCATKLECGHTCSGTCGECHQGRIHKSCAEKCDNILICGHKCSLLCRQICHPCTLPYTYECVHSKRKKSCGELPAPCRYDCLRNCKHVRCTARCGEKCTVPPCTEPCKKTLKCGHPCVGFCNDPCPPLCRICNRSELAEEVILGFEEDEDARFVLLQECGHVIESRAMELWLQKDGGQITKKCCPTCHKALSITRRYGDYIKESLTGVSEVKKKFYGNLNDKAQLRDELLKKLDDTDESTRLKPVSRQCDTARLKLQQKLQSLEHSMRLKFSGPLLKMLSLKIQIFHQICELFRESNVTRKSVKCISYVGDFLLEALIKEENSFTTQEIQDFERELKRLRRLLQLSEIEEGEDLQAVTDPRVKELYKSLLDKLYSAKKYDVEGDGKIKERLTELAEKVSFELDTSDVELEEIAKTSGVKRGVWYKCPNGHLYAVDRSEEADQTPACNECVTNE